MLRLVQDGYWVGEREDGSFYTASTVPGFLTCSRLGALPGCEYRFDDPDRQCAAGRRGQFNFPTKLSTFFLLCFITSSSGKLCGDCLPGYGTSFDLRYCLRNCNYFGIFLFVGICIVTLLLSLAVLYYDFPLPNELKGVIFFAQVDNTSTSSLVSPSLSVPLLITGDWSDLPKHTIPRSNREFNCPLPGLFDQHAGICHALSCLLLCRCVCFSDCISWVCPSNNCNVDGDFIFLLVS